MTQLKRIVVSGGGTGGHIYPALALIKALLNKYPDLDVLYVGTETGLEASIVPKAGIAFDSIKIQGIKRNLSLENLKVGWYMLTSTRRAKKILEQFKPDVVIGTGGYVCAPVLLAASNLGIPTIIHEQNSVAGLTNKFLARHVDIIATCFKEVEQDFAKYPTKIRYTGNPRAQEVVQIEVDKEAIYHQYDLDPTLPTVLIFGGSRGAPAINQAGLAALPMFENKKYQVIMATGQSHYDDFVKEQPHRFSNLTQNIKVVPYIENMPELLNVLDLVVCRSGATTLTELTALGIPSILIPSPYVTDNHQEKNALALVNHQAAIMIKEEDLTGEKLYNQIDGLINNPSQIEHMAQRARQLGMPNAADLLIKEIENLM
ncbi:undecaprenyldiphospho-muramoylpentapeptide beta-N-acetylglucosaminyltransferase [Fundicoccus culcitae]|uniref:UDP-N-acetylglucosamine--N-acetylmuramyl-(pentapeptide) pyrophosphoryl-undecaprenol N-acetylglucosamine transferase n=1 Tax=Fundicoccus culcitae TaxID=2969821 RepID=A0ABY5P605_9LACT|nr:undecaprenyldiphospho-muramoylpentapeptide beta-N-acetylglucosaminyltransferase [Fundicoccus culcitae]UUX34006.1 undecaprenyldiphospho-muramoylpentapeptide beta-N-acetylglucosaminyltransferase [Fundicoccus culcitae]